MPIKSGINYLEQKSLVCCDNLYISKIYPGGTVKFLSICAFLFIFSCSTINTQRETSYRSLSQDGSKNDLSRIEGEIYKGFYNLLEEHGWNYEKAMEAINKDGYSFGINSLSKGMRDSLLISKESSLGSLAFFIAATIFVNSQVLSGEMSLWGSAALGMSLVGSTRSGKSFDVFFTDDGKDKLRVSALKRKDKIKEIEEIKIDIVNHATITFALSAEEKTELLKFIDEEYNETIYQNLENNTKNQPKSIINIMKENEIATRRVMIYEETIERNLKDFNELSPDDLKRLNEKYTYQEKIKTMKATLRDLAKGLEGSSDRESYNSVKQALAELELIHSSQN